MGKANGVMAEPAKMGTPSPPPLTPSAARAQGAALFAGRRRRQTLRRSGSAHVTKRQRGPVTKTSVRSKAEPKPAPAVVEKRRRAPVTPQEPATAKRKSHTDADVARLMTELEAARARIAELEAAQRDTLDRIAWAIDSLHTLLDQSPE